MDLDKIKITDIVPAEYNPRKISDDDFIKLSNSIGEFGLVDPIIINLKNNKIIGGHQRYKVVEKMNDFDEDVELNLIRLGDVGWCFMDTHLKVVDEDCEKALNLALNKISGDWDFEKVNIILDELELNDFDISLTGFNELNKNEKNNVDENLYDFLDEDNINEEENKKLDYSQYDDGGKLRETLPLFKIQGKNYIRLSNEEFDELMKLYLDYQEKYRTNEGFIGKLLEGKI